MYPSFHFEASLKHILIQTPRFAIYISNGSKDHTGNKVWWGVEFFWDAIIDPQWHEPWYGKSKQFESDSVSKIDLVKKRQSLA